jgi:putative ABC transport system permease protein
VFRSYLFAALRNLARHRLYTLISVTGLSIGIAIATLAALILHQELTYDHFIPGYERLFVAASRLSPADRTPIYFPQTPGFIAASMRRLFPEIENTARLTENRVKLAHGQQSSYESVYWADPSFFELFRLPARAGNLLQALREPDSAVLTTSMARKYFGDENPLGQTLTVNGEHSVKVTAVIDDLPVNHSILERGVFLSGAAPYSGLSECDRNDIENAKHEAVSLCGITFFRLHNMNALTRLQRDEHLLLDDFPGKPSMMDGGTTFIRVDQMHLFEGLHPGARARLTEITAIGLLILFTACVVYVNLATARSARRATEVGVRKACGADRSTIMVQFLGESALFVLFATVLAVSMIELSLPQLNALLDIHVQFEYWRHPQLLAWIGVGALLLAVAAGAYPAMVLSSFRPRDVLKGNIAISGGTRLRQGLVISQSAILIMLLIAGQIVYRQRDFASHEALRLNTDQVLAISSACQQAFVDGARNLPGVQAVACSKRALLSNDSFCNCQLKDGTPFAVNDTELDFDAFKLYGIKLLAGTVIAQDSDGTSARAGTRLIINEALRRGLGFATASAAVGQPFLLKNGDGSDRAPDALISAVVPDFAFEAVTEQVRPTAYWPLSHDPPKPDISDHSDNGALDEGWNLIHLKLTGRSIPDTLQMIDTLWADTSHSLGGNEMRPIHRYFIQDYIEGLYRGILKQAQAFAFFSVIAIILASLGLLGLAAANAERRTKEIGIRKAMGAGRGDILRMLLRQFTLPVLWASLLAWPIAALLMSRWLQSFTQHVALAPRYFLVASGLALILSLLTVSAHAWRVASADPIAALRYE